MELSLLTICYLIGSLTFIIGLKMLSHPDSARKGNLVAAVGMAVAIFGTIFLYEEEGKKLGNYEWIFGGLILGTIIGVLAAKKVKMTAMPEMVSLFNGMGGACAALISVNEFEHIHKMMTPASEIMAIPGWHTQIYPPSFIGSLITIFLGLIIGSVSFAGSVIAWGKLNGKIKDFAFPGQQIFNLVLLAATLVTAGYLVFNLSAENYWLFYVIAVASLVYGILFVLPIGGADMPVVISLLNSFTGVAAACGGFLYDNQVMLTGGILVGAAGTLLTILMCKAMNRSLTNVLIGSFGGSASGGASSSSQGPQGNYKEISISDAAVCMAYANKVIIVPGYGLAVAQAQHTCHELEKLLEEKGVNVSYAIHPVAGRMPGHMNVLLAEADVSYDKLQEMEQANDEFKTTDVVLILGANDVVNPAAKTDPSSPIYGMPILEVEQAKTVIVNKRSMKPGYAGIENELFFQPKTSMLFGDAKAALQKLVAEIKAL
jgi:NAD(P) transhydrogenase subunit beta